MSEENRKEKWRREHCPHCAAGSFVHPDDGRHVIYSKDPNQIFEFVECQAPDAAYDKWVMDQDHDDGERSQ